MVRWMAWKTRGKFQRDEDPDLREWFKREMDREGPVGVPHAGGGASSGGMPTVTREVYSVLAAQGDADLEGNQGHLVAHRRRWGEFLQSSRGAAEPEAEGDAVSCAICMERRANWIFESCGHKCICKACARKQKEQAARGKKKDDKKKGSILLTRPLCRAETKVVPASRFDGDVFE